MNRELKDKILEWAGWFSLGICAVWVLLKAIGIIQSPIWIEMIPYAGAIFGAGIGFQILKDLKFRIEKIEPKMNEIEKDQIHILNETTNLNQRLSIIEQKLI